MNDSANDRAAQFRARHSPGDVVRGRIAEEERPGFYWIEIHGVRLLAHLDPGLRPGRLLAFEITSLWPEIVLRLLTDDGSSGPTPQGLAADWLAARAALEDALAHASEACESSPLSLQDGKLAALFPRRSPLATAMARARASLAVLNDNLLRPRGAVLDYFPLLLPGAPGVERLTVRQPDGMLRLLADAVHPDAGRVRLTGAARGADASYRVQAEHPEALPRLLSSLEAILVLADAPRWSLLGATALTSAPQPLLAPFLGPSSALGLRRRYV
ncbi:hypothetical protein dsx2_2822 [Desulfovibrio sp. X2]|uniref:hypothetical protein n=1 Tax=Desulfovibrio sp. X2 TaxID=941449 RepID=UPI000358AE42|nr:hypothetical protein [Desulfovibrio sp. X2]EPR42433.1 hypothetical protein dsx2_2822 [Desulfovibrio sp. X2]